MIEALAEPGVVILVLAVAVGFSIIGTLGYTRSGAVSRAEIVMEQRLHSLEVEVARLRQEVDSLGRQLARAEAERDSYKLEAERLRAQNSAAVGGGYDDEGAPRKPSRRPSNAAKLASLGKQLGDLRSQLSVLDQQITAQGGPDRAEYPLLTQRTDKQRQIAALEGEIDDLKA